MQITEPSTMITDYLLAFVILVLSGRLFSLNQAERQRSIQLWNFGFVATALAALLGGSSHGFALYLNAFAKAAIWKGTVYAIGVASFFLLAGTIIASVSHPLRRWLLLFATLKLLIYATWMLTHNDFSFVIYDYVPAMIGVILLQLYAHVKRRDRSAVWLISGVLVSFASAGIQLSGFVLHEHFNHNDLYHVVQMGAMYLFYRGICLLKDQ